MIASKSCFVFKKKPKHIYCINSYFWEAENWDWNHDTVIKDLANEEHWPTDSRLSRNVLIHDFALIVWGDFCVRSWHYLYN